MGNSKRTYNDLLTRDTYGKYMKENEKRLSLLILHNYLNFSIQLLLSSVTYLTIPCLKFAYL